MVETVELVPKLYDGAIPIDSSRHRNFKNSYASSTPAYAGLRGLRSFRTPGLTALGGFRGRIPLMILNIGPANLCPF